MRLFASINIVTNGFRQSGFSTVNSRRYNFHRYNLHRYNLYRYYVIPILLLLLPVLPACKEQQTIFPPVMDAQTRGYCGSCHMAFQPSMLPAASWRQMMKELDNHFKEKVELKPAVIQHITDYLVANAGDSKAAGTAGRIALLGLTQNSNLQRITNTPYFKDEHRFLKNRILDEWVDSVANCTACHVGAWVGDYRE